MQAGAQMLAVRAWMLDIQIFSAANRLYLSAKGCIFLSFPRKLTSTAGDYCSLTPHAGEIAVCRYLVAGLH